MMQDSHLENSEIAFYPGYAEETYLVRDCRKVFGLNARQLRRLSQDEFRDLVSVYLVSGKSYRKHRRG